jgi:hypothetical protein
MMNRIRTVPILMLALGAVAVAPRSPRPKGTRRAPIFTVPLSS